MTRVLAGRRSVLEALGCKTRVHHVYTDPQRAHADVREAAAARGVPVTNRNRAELDQLSEGARHQGVVALADDYRFVNLDELLKRGHGAPTLIALDQVTDPQNLGAIIRSAVTLGTDGVIIPKHRAASITAAVVRASAGATEHASIARVTNLQRTLLALRESGLQIVGLDANAAVDVREIGPNPGGRVLVVGAEGKGLRRMVRQRCDIVVQIPQKGPMDSLNASVAAAIAIYEIVGKQRGITDDG